MKTSFYLLFGFLLILSHNLKCQVSGNALRFDGTNYLTIGDNAAFSLQANSSTTFEGWIRFCSDGTVFSKNWCQGEAGYYMSIVNGGAFRVKGLSQSTCNSGDLFELTTIQPYAYNTWHHFAFVIESLQNVTFVKLYINGVLELSSIESGIVYNSSENLIIGAYKNLAGNYTLPFLGDIDEFRIYNTALTLAEMGQTTPPPTNLVLHYTFEPQQNTSSANEPNLGSMGTSYNGQNRLVSSPNSSTPLNFFGSDDLVPSMDLGPDLLADCGSSEITLSTNSTATNYNWFDSTGGVGFQQIPGVNSSSLIYSLTGGLTQVTVTGEMGMCFDSDTVSIFLAENTVNLGNDTTICLGDTLNLDVFVQGGDYLWSNGSMSPTMNIWLPGVYIVEVLLNGCLATDSIVIDIMDSPLVDLGDDLVICPNESITLSSSTSLSNFTWQDGTTNPTMTASAAGIYWLSSSNVCGVGSDSIVVSVSPQFTVDLGVDTTICQGNTLLLQPNLPNSSSLWSDGSVGDTFAVTETGTYHVSVSIEGCVESDEIFVLVESPPNVDLGEDRRVCSTDSYLLSLKDNFPFILWGDGRTGNSVIVDASGEYSVIVGNSCGLDSASISVEMVDCFCELYLPNAFTPNGDEFNTTFAPIFDCKITYYKLTIYNRWGEILFESYDSNYAWDGTYAGKILQDGTYIYKVVYSSEFESHKEIMGHVSVLR